MTVAALLELQRSGFTEPQVEALAEHVDTQAQAATRADLIEPRSDLSGLIAELRAELRRGLAELRGELRREIAEARGERLLTERDLLNKTGWPSRHFVNIQIKARGFPRPHLRLPGTSGARPTWRPGSAAGREGAGRNRLLDRFGI